MDPQVKEEALKQLEELKLGDGVTPEEKKEGGEEEGAEGKEENQGDLTMNASMQDGLMQ